VDRLAPDDRASRSTSRNQLPHFGLCRGHPPPDGDPTNRTSDSDSANSAADLRPPYGAANHAACDTRTAAANLTGHSPPGAADLPRDTARLSP